MDLLHASSLRASLLALACALGVAPASDAQPCRTQAATADPLGDPPCDPLRPATAELPPPAPPAASTLEGTVAPPGAPGKPELVGAASPDDPAGAHVLLGDAPDTDEASSPGSPDTR